SPILLACDADPSPAAIAVSNNYNATDAYPYVDDESGIWILQHEAPQCNVVATYEDSNPVAACAVGCQGTVKFVRTWSILNWCTGTVMYRYQVIKLVDDIAPVINVSSPAPIGTDSWICGKDVVLPTAMVVDRCDSNASIISIVGPVPVIFTGGNWEAQDLGQGCHEFTYVASDCCGNTSTAVITVTILDKTPPVAIAKEFIVVSLTDDGGAIDTHAEQVQGGGVAKI